MQNHKYWSGSTFSLHHDLAVNHFVNIWFSKWCWLFKCCIAITKAYANKVDKFHCTYKSSIYVCISCHPIIKTYISACPIFSQLISVRQVKLHLKLEFTSQFKKKNSQWIYIYLHVFHFKLDICALTEN